MNKFLDEFKNAFNRPDNALVQLILINVIVFAVLGIFNVIASIGGFESIFEVVAKQFLIPAPIETFLSRPWTLLTYAFYHGGILHIFFNMLMLYWFGKLVKEYIGSAKLISIYLIGALAGAVLFLLAYNLIPYYADNNQLTVMVGASGAVYAIIVAAATLLPEYTFYLLLLGPVRLKYIAAVAILISFLGTSGSNAGGDIAHLGGALMGYIYIQQMRKGTDLGKPFIAVINFFKGLFKKRSKIKVSYTSKNVHRNYSPNRREDQKNWSKTEQDEIDAILDKINEKGYESLSKEEKQKLFKASKK